MGANAHMRPKQQRSICIQSWKWTLKVVDLLASSQSSGRIIWKHYGSLWRTNKMLDIKCLVLTMYWKAMAVFWRNGCAAPSPALFCVCLCVYMCFFLFSDSVLSSLQNNLRCCFALCFAPLCFEALGVQVMWKVWSCFSWDCTWCSKTRPDHMNSKLQWVLPSLPSTKPVSAQHGDSVCSVRWLPGLKHDAAAEWSPNTTCFLPSSPTFFSSASPLFLCLFVSVSIARKKHMFPSEGRRIKHKLFLVKGWVLFQGQSETLSERQRAIRALAQTQVCTEYIWSVNICIQRINGLDRPLITD